MESGDEGDRRAWSNPNARRLEPHGIALERHNGDKVWQHGEQGAAPTSSAGGVAARNSIPNLQDSARAKSRRSSNARWWRTSAFTSASSGARSISCTSSDNLNRPVSAYNVPITVRIPNPNGILSLRDGPTLQAFNLSPANLALPVVNFLHNTPGKDDFYNLELSANRRVSNGWSLNAFVLVSLEQRQRQRVFRPEPARAGRTWRTRTT